jgi:hypothetical protein
MNQNPKQPAELMSLLNSLVSEDITDDEMARLELLLRENPEGQDELLAYSQLHIDLMVDLGADRATKAFCDRQAQFAFLAAPILMREEEPESIIPAIPPRMFGALNWGMLGGLTLCAAIVIGGLIWSSVGLNDDDPIANNPVAVDSPKAPAVTSIQFGSNSAEIGLEKIGRVTIHYPADFRLIGPMRARLNHGRINMRVTEQSGHGFVVETPDGEVIDLGTEFGLDVAPGRSTNLIVREGAVDLRVGGDLDMKDRERVERLVGGEAVSFAANGGVQRIMSVLTSRAIPAPHNSDIDVDHLQPLISSVSDTIRAPGMKSYYEIVQEGLREDAVAYVDRVHQWNGTTKSGLPSYLVGADYVKPFNDDKMSKSVKVTLTLARPAKLYVFFDVRLAEPKWLLKDFRKTGDVIGLDMGPQYNPKTGRNTSRRVQVGSGASVDHTFAIWEREVTEPGKVVLGANNGGTAHSGMYGIAAVELSIGEGNHP